MTPSQERGRAYLMLRMPTYRAAFQALVADQVFLDICEAYDLAHTGMEYWSGSEQAVRDKMIADYRELLISLESDARNRAASQGHGHGP